MAHQRVLDLDRIDIAPSAQNDLRRAPDDVDKTVIIEPRELTRIVPAILERLARRRIAAGAAKGLGHARSGASQAPDLTGRQWPPALVDDLHLPKRRRPAHAVGTVGDISGREEGD